MHTVPMPPAGLSSALSRGLDIGFAIAALVMLSPLIFFIVVAILVETGPPVLFRQTRLGRGGRHFTMYKFRKFSACQKDGCPLTRKDDERLTRVGKVLAKTKLDELPQLINILRGEMSVVGPRPESLAFADCFQGEHCRVLAFRPGIFGPSQAMFRNEADLYPKNTDPIAFYRSTLFPRKANLDLAYYYNRSVVDDIRWVMRGVLAVFGGINFPTPVHVEEPAASSQPEPG
jgi:lipopolysaccharide/colanic/teichoic acid biosynthesis glycosyltransferase